MDLLAETAARGAGRVAVETAAVEEFDDEVQQRCAHALVRVCPACSRTEAALLRLSKTVWMRGCTNWYKVGPRAASYLSVAA
jgi:hypothetical protein